MFMAQHSGKIQAHITFQYINKTCITWMDAKEYTEQIPNRTNVPPFNVPEEIPDRLATGKLAVSGSAENAVVSMGTSGPEWKLYAALIGCVW